MRPPVTRLLVLLAASSVGCGYSTLEARRVPNPVLLGPVDRVGGHRAGDEKTVAPISDEVFDFASATSQTSQVGNTVVRKTTASAISTGSGNLTRKVLAATHGRADRDVRVDTIPAGGYALVSAGAAMSNRWVGLEGRVVEVSHVR